MEELDLKKLKELVKEGAGESKRVELRPKVESVDEIVEKVLKKYEQEGAFTASEEGEYKPIEQLITPSVSISGSPEDLARSRNPIVRATGVIYTSFRGFFDKITSRLFDNRFVRNLDLSLYAAGMPFTGLQYAVFALVFSSLVAVVSFLVFITYAIVSGNLLAPIFAFVIFLIMLGVILAYPNMKAKSRAKAAEKQLPYALRHLAVLLRSGAGFYQALKMVAAGDYGVLSEEFKRTVMEIEEGKSTKEALSNLAIRMRGSKGIRRAVAQLLRALRIGGKISNVISDIARDVSFEQRMRVSQYGEKLNVFGIFFMFLAVVFPVMIAMLSAVGYSPAARSILAAFRIPVPTLQMMYLVVFPLAILMYVHLIRAMDPMR